MTGADLLSDAVAELYSCDPDDFTERRGDLAAQARAGGQALVAKQIAGLRKPTRAAWVVNQLVRSEPGIASRLAALGDDLRAAEGLMDGARIRELSLARRQLIEALVGQAFAVSGQPAPSAALREEVTATLGAALADPQVTEQLRAGTLVRAARWDGFGSAAAHTLTPVPSPAGDRTPVLRAVTDPARPASGAVTDPVRPASRAAPASRATPAPSAAAAARAKAERDRRREAIAAAERAAAMADKAVQAAARAEGEQEGAVALLEQQLTEARQRLADARQEARRAKSAQRQAHKALDRTRK